MAPKPVEFDPRAVQEAGAARRWYARRSPAVARRFLEELDRAVERIGAGPETWPAYLHSTRVFSLRRFPYLVVFREGAECVQVLAVAHSHRKPGYWKRRTH